MSIAVEGLEIEVKSKADLASKSIKTLTEQMSKLREVCKNGANLPKVAKALNEISTALSSSGADLKDFAINLKSVENASTKALKKVVKAKEEISGNIATSSLTDLSNPQNYVKLQNSSQEFYKNLLGIYETYESSVDISTALKQEIDNADEGVKRHIKGWKEIKESIKGSLKLTNKFVKSLSRIAVYRALRTIIKSVTDTISQGMENAYLYSQKFGGEFARLRDELASSYLQMKNQIGSAFSELFIMAKPMLETLIQKVIEFANVLSQVFAYLNGDTQYKKAQYVATSWKDATGAVKEYKSQVLGIDELNILEEQKNGGSGSSGVDVSDMFNYEPIGLSEGLKDKLDFIKENFDNILEVVKAIGIAIASWKISKAISSLFTDSLRVPAGLTLAITGAYFEFEGVKDWVMNGADWFNVLETFLGAGGLIAGGAIAFGAGSLFVTIPLVLTIPLVAINVGTKEKAEEDFANSAYAQWLNDFNKQVKATTDLIEPIQLNIELREEEMQTAINDALELKGKLDLLFELNELEHPTSKELDQIKSLVADINANSDLQIELDPDGNIVETREQLYGALTDLLAFQLQAMATQNSTQALYDLSSASYAEKKALDELTIAQEEWNVAQADTDEKYRKFSAYVQKNSNNPIAFLSKSYKELKQEYENAKVKSDALNQTLKVTEDNYHDARMAVSDCKDQLEEYEYIAEHSQEFAELYLNGTLKDTADGYAYVKEQTDKATDATKKNKSALESETTAVKATTTALKDESTAVDNSTTSHKSHSDIMAEEIKKSVDATKELNDNTEKLKTNTGEVKNSNTSVLTLIESLNTNKSALDKQKGAIDETTTKLTAYKTETDNATQTTDKYKDAISGVGTTAKDKVGSLMEFAEQVGAFGSKSELATNKLSGLSGAISGIGDAFSSQISGVNALASAIEGVYNKLTNPPDTTIKINTNASALVSKGVTAQAKLNGGIVKMYASGGAPAHGQLFIANEGSSPEMIGKWGSQTAVANTDQIVNGIQAGVASAVNAVLAPYLARIESNTRETASKDFSVRIGDRDIANANNRGQRLIGARLVVN